MELTNLRLKICIVFAFAVCLSIGLANLLSELTEDGSQTTLCNGWPVDDIFTSNEKYGCEGDEQWQALSDSIDLDACRSLCIAQIAHTGNLCCFASSASGCSMKPGGKTVQDSQGGLSMVCRRPRWLVFEGSNGDQQSDESCFWPLIAVASTIGVAFVCVVAKMYPYKKHQTIVSPPVKTFTSSVEEPLLGTGALDGDWFHVEILSCSSAEEILFPREDIDRTERMQGASIDGWIEVEGEGNNEDEQVVAREIKEIINHS